ncbi:hypothetical protein YC2023_106254 [Brassica napus]
MNVRWRRSLGRIWWVLRPSGDTARRMWRRWEVGVGFWVGFRLVSIFSFCRSTTKLLDWRRVVSTGGSSVSDLFFTGFSCLRFPGGMARRRVILLRAKRLDVRVSRGSNCSRYGEVFFNGASETWPGSSCGVSGRFSLDVCACGIGFKTESSMASTLPVIVVLPPCPPLASALLPVSPQSLSRLRFFVLYFGSGLQAGQYPGSHGLSKSD